jgi:hypothetical protein
LLHCFYIVFTLSLYCCHTVVTLMPALLVQAKVTLFLYPPVLLTPLIPFTLLAHKPCRPSRNSVRAYISLHSLRSAVLSAGVHNLFSYKLSILRLCADLGVAGLVLREEREASVCCRCLDITVTLYITRTVTLYNIRTVTF